MTKHRSIIGSDPVKKETYRLPGDHPGDTLQIIHKTINRIRKGDDRPEKPRGETSPCYQTSIPGIEPDIPLDQVEDRQIGKRKHTRRQVRKIDMTRYLQAHSELYK